MEAIIVLNSSLTINQTWNHYTNTFFDKYKDILTGKVKAQKIATHWMGISVAHKYRWHIHFDNVFKFLSDKNTGTLLCGRAFVKVFEYFSLGCDETCCIASECHICVVGGKEKR